MNKISALKLYLIFLKIGAILLGGGYVILPIITHELVEKRGLLRQEEVVDFFTLSQSLPGIIAANISMFIGYKLHGKFGAFLAMLGVITAPFIIISVLASIITIFIENSYLQAALWGIGIAVIALILLTIREVWQNSTRDMFFYLIFALALVALTVFNLSPIKTILIVTVLGVILKKLTTSKEVR